MTDTPPTEPDKPTVTPIDELSTARVAYIRARLCSELETETDETARAESQTVIDYLDDVLSRRGGGSNDAGEA